MQLALAGYVMNSFIKFLPLLARTMSAAALLAATASCTLLGTHGNAAAKLEPQIRLRSVDEAYLGGVDVFPLCQPSEVSLAWRNQLITGYVNKDLPLRMHVQLNAYNPNVAPTAIVGLDYIVMVDGKPLGNGRQLLPLDLPAHDSVRLPLTFELNTYKYLGDDALPALRNFATGFGDARRKRVAVQVRPLLRLPKGRLSTQVSYSASTSQSVLAQK
jgi:hypothetical protein